MDVTRQEFMDTVVHIVFRDNCNTRQAMIKAQKELGMSNTDIANLGKQLLLERLEKCGQTSI